MQLSQAKNEVQKIGVRLKGTSTNYLNASAFWCEVTEGDVRLLTSAHVLRNLQSSSRKSMKADVEVHISSLSNLNTTVYNCTIEIHPLNNVPGYLNAVGTGVHPPVDVAWIKPCDGVLLPKAAVFCVEHAIPPLGCHVIGVGFIDQYLEQSTMFGVFDSSNVLRSSYGYKIRGGALPACSGSPFFVVTKVSNSWTEEVNTTNLKVIGMLNGAINLDFYSLQSSKNFHW
ncbi:TPA: hypothetical protein ACGUVR_004787 [Vibrio vulnificus]